jgi:HAMP domain-containing protein
MLNSLLLYIGDIQREGRFVTSRIRLKLILNIVAVFLLVLAFIAAIIGGCIYLAHHIGAGPAALSVAAAAFALAIIVYIWLDLLDRSNRRANIRSATAAGSPIAAVTATQVATQAAVATILKKRPYLTLVASVALGYLATRSSMRKK